jgi:Phosphate acetyl/butaryl transferase
MHMLLTPLQCMSTHCLSAASLLRSGCVNMCNADVLIQCNWNERLFAVLHRAQVLVYGDCAVNVSPSAGDLANIAVASADTAAAFGVRPPRVALLSYSTGASGSGAEVEKVGTPWPGE